MRIWQSDWQTGPVNFVIILQGGCSINVKERNESINSRLLTYEISVMLNK